MYSTRADVRNTMSVDFSVTNTNISMNVANGSAALILFELLGYSRDDFDGLYGDLDASDVMRRLALSEHKAPSLVTPTRETRGVHIDANGVGEGCLVVDFGYDEDRIMRYATTLQIMADRAQSLGESISFG